MFDELVPQAQARHSHLDRSLSVRYQRVTLRAVARFPSRESVTERSHRSARAGPYDESRSRFVACYSNSARSEATCDAAFPRTISTMPSPCSMRATISIVSITITCGLPAGATSSTALKLCSTASMSVGTHHSVGPDERPRSLSRGPGRVRRANVAVKCHDDRYSPGKGTYFRCVVDWFNSSKGKQSDTLAPHRRPCGGRPHRLQERRTKNHDDPTRAERTDGRARADADALTRSWRCTESRRDHARHGRRSFELCGRRCKLVHIPHAHVTQRVQARREEISFARAAKAGPNRAGFFIGIAGEPRQAT